MKKTKKLLIEFLHSDLKECLRCQMSEQSMEASVEHLKNAIKKEGFTASIVKIPVITEKEAKKYEFSCSPTIKINGTDIEEIIHGSAKNEKDYCGSCSSIKGEKAECRTFKYDGKTYQYIPRRMIVEAINKVIYS